MRSNEAPLLLMVPFLLIGTAVGLAALVGTIASIGDFVLKNSAQFSAGVGAIFD